jgi:hypothetical protein
MQGGLSLLRPALGHVPVREEDAALQKGVRGAPRQPLYPLHQLAVYRLAPKLGHKLVVVNLAVGAASHVPRGHHLSSRRVADTRDRAAAAGGGGVAPAHCAVAAAGEGLQIANCGPCGLNLLLEAFKARRHVKDGGGWRVRLTCSPSCSCCSCCPSFGCCCCSPLHAACCSASPAVMVAGCSNWLLFKPKLLFTLTITSATLLQATGDMHFRSKMQQGMAAPQPAGWQMPDSFATKSSAILNCKSSSRG